VPQGDGYPDVLHVGQIILLHVLTGLPQSKPAQTANVKQPSRLKGKIKDTYIPFTIKYKLDDLPLIKYDGPGFKATIKLSGDVVITLGHMVPLTYVTIRGLELNYKGQTDDAFNRLISNQNVSWDKKTNNISYSCTMTAKSSQANTPCSSIGVAIASNKPVPVLRADIIFPTLTGHISADKYCAVNVKSVVELEPKVDSIQKLHPQVPATNSVISTSKLGTWTFVSGVTLMSGIVISNFFTRGNLTAANEVLIPLALSRMGFTVNQEIPGQRTIKIDIFTGSPDLI
jgi:hypothetical protein